MWPGLAHEEIQGLLKHEPQIPAEPRANIIMGPGSAQKGRTSGLPQQIDSQCWTHSAIDFGVANDQAQSEDSWASAGGWLTSR
jgi:hypothetical protein